MNRLSTNLRTIIASTSVAGTVLAAIAASGQTPPSPDFIGAWQLVRFQGGDDRVLTPDDRTKYTVEFLSDGGLNARIDCNRGRGTWKSPGPSHLQFGPLALTRALCPPGSMHDQIVKQWPFIRSYVMKDGQLFLSLMADGGIFEFEPVSGTKPSASQSPVAPSAALEGPVWRLTRVPGVTDQALAALTRPPTLRFDSGRVQAFSGCNSLAGSYSVDGDRVTFGKLVGTLMACAPAVMAIESAFNKTLRGTLRVRIAKSELTFTSESDSTTELVFVAEPPPTIEGVSWEVTLLDNGRQALASPLAGTKLTMVFKDGSISGTAGCNTFQGKYTRQDNRLMIGPVAATRKFCAAEGVMDQERRFLAAIESAASWAIEGDVLDVRRANASGVVRARKP